MEDYNRGRSDGDLSLEVYWPKTVNVNVNNIIYTARWAATVQTPAPPETIQISGRGVGESVIPAEPSDFTRDGYWWRMSPSGHARLKAHFTAVLRSYVGSGEFLNQYTPAYIGVIGDSRWQMNDVVGGGFASKGSGTILCNPCQSSTRRMSVDTPASAADPRPSYNLVTRSENQRPVPGNTMYSQWTGSIFGTAGGSYRLPSEAYYAIENALMMTESLNGHSSMEASVWKQLQGNAVSILVTALEVGKTMAYVSDKIRECARLLTRFKRNLLFPSPGGLKTVADRWLEYRYALTPLILDVQGAVKAATARKSLDLIVRGSSRLNGSVSSNFEWKTIIEGQEVEIVIESTTTTLDRLCGFGHVKKATNSDTVAMQRLYATNQLLEAAWEVVPWSFIVDWFINVGDCLARLTPITGYTFRCWTKSWKNVCSYSGTVTWKTPTGPITSPIQGELTYYRRTVEWASGPPSLTMSNGLNPTRISDAVALLRIGR